MCFVFLIDISDRQVFTPFNFDCRHSHILGDESKHLVPVGILCDIDWNSWQRLPVYLVPVTVHSTEGQAVRDGDHGCGDRHGEAKPVTFAELRSLVSRVEIGAWRRSASITIEHRFDSIPAMLPRLPRAVYMPMPIALFVSFPVHPISRHVYVQQLRAHRSCWLPRHGSEDT